jgi:hypothetical protein
MNTEVPDFYSWHGLHVQIYDDQTARGWDTPQNDTSFYLEEARAGDGPILELGCGTGGYRSFMGFSPGCRRRRR